MYVKFGNTAAKEGLRQGDEIVWRKIQGTQITTFSLQDDLSIETALTEIIDGWAWHSNANPEWVESDSPALGQRLAAHFNCPYRKDEDETDSE